MPPDNAAASSAKPSSRRDASEADQFLLASLGGRAGDDDSDRNRQAGRRSCLRPAKVGRKGHLPSGHRARTRCGGHDCRRRRALASDAIALKTDALGALHAPGASKVIGHPTGCALSGAVAPQPTLCALQHAGVAVLAVGGRPHAQAKRFGPFRVAGKRGVAYRARLRREGALRTFGQDLNDLALVLDADGRSGAFGPFAGDGRRAPAAGLGRAVDHPTSFVNGLVELKGFGPTGHADGVSSGVRLETGLDRARVEGGAARLHSIRAGTTHGSPKALHAARFIEGVVRGLAAARGVDAKSRRKLEAGLEHAGAARCGLGRSALGGRRGTAE